MRGVCGTARDHGVRHADLYFRAERPSAYQAAAEDPEQARRVPASACGAGARWICPIAPLSGERDRTGGAHLSRAEAQDAPRR